MRLITISGSIKVNNATGGVGFTPVAVPDKIFGLSLLLDFIDRCHSLWSLLPPPAALPSLPL